MNLKPKVKTLWDHVTHSATVKANRLRIDDSRVKATKSKIPFKNDDCYVQLVVNDVFLADTRVWTKKFIPFAYVIINFDYDKSTHTQTTIVYTSRFPKGVGQRPDVSWGNVIVWEPFPFRGKQLKLGIVLCKLKIKDYAEDILHLLESTASTLNVGLTVGSYLKVASVVKQGLEKVLDFPDTGPVLGHDQSFTPSDPIPGYFLIARKAQKTKQDLNEQDLWINSHSQLKVMDPNKKKLTDLQGFDYILYSVNIIDRRADLRKLPFYTTYEAALKAARGGKESPGSKEEWNKHVRPLLDQLSDEINDSPDLIEKQAKEVYDTYKDKVISRYNQANKS
jgi:hypothetical protein